MDVRIQANEDKKRNLPHRFFPIYRLLCEQIGFETRWDPSEKLLQLTPGLHGKKVFLVLNKKDDQLASILESIKTFFNGTGVKFIQLDPNKPAFKNGEIMLQLTKLVHHSSSHPRFHIFYSRGGRGKFWARTFHREFKVHGFTAQMKRELNQHPIPKVDLRCQFPQEGENEAGELNEKIAVILSSALLRGMTKGNLLALLPYVSIENIRLIFPGIGNLFPGSESSLSTPMKDTGSPVDEEQPDQMVSPSTQAAFLPEWGADVYFDYQVVVPDSDTDPYLIFGSMVMKNTGRSDLIDPIICLQVNPTEGAQLKGQIVPPKMADTLAVQGFNGDSATGWRYLEDDWMKKVKERGEYWICPIQPLRIAPGEMESFSNFQLSVPKPEKGRTITIQGILFFKDGNFQVPTSNRITISF
jgi:hypothetical protein